MQRFFLALLLLGAVVVVLSLGIRTLRARIGVGDAVEGDEFMERLAFFALLALILYVSFAGTA
ncbi:MAG: hypothetical protein AAFR35_05160 [Pseudomonadota bacterium]